MPSHPIAQQLLRTTDPVGATAFYDAVLGHHGDAVYLLHENAIARGARSHWVGCVDTPDAEGVAALFLADGGQRLGPRPGGGLILRDPGGALVAFGPVDAPSVAGVGLHVLRSRDAAAAEARYAATFGWSFRASAVEGVRTFAWSAGGPDVGVIQGVEDSPGVHPQWLPLFRVPDVDAAVTAARDLGATLLPLAALPDGRRYAIGDDPQGAAFGLLER